MTDPSKKNDPADTDEAEIRSDEAAEAAASDEAAADDDMDAGDGADIEDFAARLEAEKADLTERFVRLAADMDNLRKRANRDIKDAKAYSIANFARDMLGVADNLRRALDAIPEDARKGEDAGFKALIEGVEMTERAMLGALERHGVKKLEPEGEKFDPHFHQAMFEVPNPDVAANTVVQVVQAGYVIGDRVLRPAMVGVAKGGPKQAAEAEPGPVNEQAEKDA